jgi:hypothetical protein
MYKILSASAIAAALLFSVPQTAAALPGQGTTVKTSKAVTAAHYEHHRRYYRDRRHHHRSGIRIDIH